MGYGAGSTVRWFSAANGQPTDIAKSAIRAYEGVKHSRSIFVQARCVMGDKEMGSPEVRHAPKMRKTAALEEWYASPTFLGPTAILSLVSAFAGLGLAVYPFIFSNDMSGISRWATLSIFAMIAALSSWSIFELYRNTELKNEVAAHILTEVTINQEKQSLEEALQNEIRIRNELLGWRDAKERYLSEFFVGRASARATHSALLYLLQKSALELPISNVGQRIFMRAWEHQRDYLSEFCTAVALLFTHIKGGSRCCSNIKIFFDHTNGALTDVSQTEYGVDQTIVHPANVSTKTVARCHVSRTRGRVRDDERPILDNYIFRQIYA